MEIKRNPSFKRPILIPQKTVIKFDLDAFDSIQRESKPISQQKLETKNNDNQKVLKRKDEKFEYKNLSDSFIKRFIENSGMSSQPTQDMNIMRTRVIEEMYRINERANITTEERKKLFHLALTMDAPRLARKLVSDLNEVNSPANNLFLTNDFFENLPNEEFSKDDNNDVEAKDESNLNLEEDEMFYKAIDEVERIRKRMLKRASLSDNDSTIQTSTTNEAIVNSNKTNGSLESTNSNSELDIREEKTSRRNILSPRVVHHSFQNNEFDENKSFLPRISSTNENSGSNIDIINESATKFPFKRQNTEESVEVLDDDKRISHHLDSIIGTLPSSRPGSRINSARKKLVSLSTDSSSKINHSFRDPFSKATSNKVDATSVGLNKAREDLENAKLTGNYNSFSIKDTVDKQESIKSIDDRFFEMIEDQQFEKPVTPRSGYMKSHKPPPIDIPKLHKLPASISGRKHSGRIRSGRIAKDAKDGLLDFVLGQEDSQFKKNKRAIKIKESAKKLISSPLSHWIDFGNINTQNLKNKKLDPNISENESNFAQDTMAFKNDAVGPDLNKCDNTQEGGDKKIKMFPPILSKPSFNFEEFEKLYSKRNPQMIDNVRNSLSVLKGHLSPLDLYDQKTSETPLSQNQTAIKSSEVPNNQEVNEEFIPENESHLHKSYSNNDIIQLSRGLNNSSLLDVEEPSTMKHQASRGRILRQANAKLDALAAALNAGDAVGQLVAEMISFDKK